MKRGDMTDGIFLVHIVDALREMIDFTKDVTLEGFLDSTLLVRGVTASFEIAGEATKNMTQEFRDAHPEIKWRDMAGFRDVLIHGYFGIDASRLWTGAKEFARRQSLQSRRLKNINGLERKTPSFKAFPSADFTSVNAL